MCLNYTPNKKPTTWQLWRIVFIWSTDNLQDTDAALSARLQHGTGPGARPAQLRLAERFYSAGGGVQRREERGVLPLLRCDGRVVAVRVEHSKRKPLPRVRIELWIVTQRFWLICSARSSGAWSLWWCRCFRLPICFIRWDLSSPSASSTYRGNIHLNDCSRLDSIRLIDSSFNSIRAELRLIQFSVSRSHESPI